MAALFGRSSCGTQTDMPPKAILVRLGQVVCQVDFALAKKTAGYDWLPVERFCEGPESKVAVSPLAKKPPREEEQPVRETLR